MAKSADAVRNGLVLRLSLPASGELRGLAADLAVKLGEQLGLTGDRNDGLAGTIEELVGRLQPPPHADVAFEFYKGDRELTVAARSADRAAEARIPLPA